MRHAARRDSNHGSIEAVFRQMLGDHVTDCSKMGGGLGDLFVSFGAFPGIFIEIKRDDKADYTAAQVRFQRTHLHAVMRCESEEQAIQQAKMIRKWAQAMA